MWGNRFVGIFVIKQRHRTFFGPQFSVSSAIQTLRILWCLCRLPRKYDQYCYNIPLKCHKNSRVDDWVVVVVEPVVCDVAHLAAVPVELNPLTHTCSNNIKQFSCKRYFFLKRHVNKYLLKTVTCA